MAVGDVWLAYAWQGAYAALMRKGVPVVYANPKEGRASWVGVYGIRKGTKNHDLALKFVDEKLSTATANNVITEFNYGVANGEVMNSISDPTLNKAFSLDDPSVLERSNFTPELMPSSRSWTAVDGGQSSLRSARQTVALPICSWAERARSGASG
jgi:spermidine/putrescine-binding protein